MRKFLFLLMAVILAIGQLQAQQKTITGRVTDVQGNRVPNASVIVKGTTIGTTTNSEGNFSLSVPSTARVLVISSINFEPAEVAISNQSVVSVSLKTTESTLKEIVVVGYSTSTKEAFTGSAKQVTGDDLNSKNVSNLSKALTG